MEATNIQKIESVINSIESTSSFSILLNAIKNLYVNLKEDTKILFFEINQKYFEMSLAEKKDCLDIDILKDVYFKFKVNGFEFTFMLDDFEKVKFPEFVNELFLGNYFLNLYSEQGTTKVLEFEIVWNKKELSQYNQRIKTYLPINIFKKNKQLITETSIGYNWTNRLSPILNSFKDKI